MTSFDLVATLGRGGSKGSVSRYAFNLVRTFKIAKSVFTIFSVIQKHAPTNLFFAPLITVLSVFQYAALAGAWPYEWPYRDGFNDKCCT